MSPRRAIALVVLLLDAWFAWRMVPHVPGIFMLLGYLLAAVVAILAVGVLVFNLPWRRPGPPVLDSGYDIASPVDFGLSTLGILLFALAPLFIAGRGLWQGVLPTLGAGPDVVFAQTPYRFLAVLALWLAWGLAVLWLLYRTSGVRKAHIARQRAGKGDT